MEDCLFCKIVEGQIPSTKVYEDEWVYCFEDINPQARVHVLVVPRAHLRDAADDLPLELLGRMARAAEEVARIKGITQSGYRLVMNTGADARQSVAHLHMHVLGGEQLSERMA